MGRCFISVIVVCGFLGEYIVEFWMKLLWSGGGGVGFCLVIWCMMIFGKF